MKNSKPILTAQTDLQRYLENAVQALAAGEDAQAQKAVETVLATAPDTPLAVLMLGVLQTHQRLPHALDTLKRAVSLAPGDPQFHYNYAVTLAEHGQDDLALVAYRACLACNPDHRDALWNYGEMLRLREHFALALSLFDRLYALEGTRRHKMAHRMAVCCAHLDGQSARADALFQEQIAIDDDPKTHWEYALHQLDEGRFETAWPHYARRFDAGESISVHRACWPYPFWDGNFRPGTLLVSGEQGAGDELLFAAFLPELLQRAQASGMQVIVACHAGLVRLFQSSFPQAQVVAHNVSRPADFSHYTQGISWQFMLGDLPLFIPKPAPAAYLRPDPQDIDLLHRAVQEQMQQMQQLPGQRVSRKVGMVWSANPVLPQANRQSRNVPPLLVAGHAANCQGVQFFSLQTEDHRASLAHLADMPIADMSHLLSDFSRTAALMLQMDTVVSVCTSTANLAGALGCDTRVLLKKHGDWRWLQDTTWFARAQTYRQTVSGDWSLPLSEVFNSLCQEARAARNPAS